MSQYLDMDTVKRRLIAGMSPIRIGQDVKTRLYILEPIINNAKLNKLDILNIMKKIPPMTSIKSDYPIDSVEEQAVKGAVDYINWYFKDAMATFTAQINQQGITGGRVKNRSKSKKRSKSRK